MFIPNECLVIEGKESKYPEGKEIRCSICNQKFLVPQEIADQLDSVPVCENQACKEAYEKAQAAIKVTEMKQSDDSSITSDLGNKLITD